MLDRIDSSVAVNRITEGGKTISIEIRLLMSDEEMPMHDYPPNRMLAVDCRLLDFVFALCMTDTVPAALQGQLPHRIDDATHRGR